jgi:bacterioferritin-associated ferredoxin
MYLCICNAVRESDLHAAVAAGRSFAEFSAQTGCAGTCGTCLEDAQSLYQQAKSELKASKPFGLPVLAFA